MRSLLLQGNSKRKIEILEELAKMIGLKARHIIKAELEDIGLANAMKKGRTGQYIETDSYIKKLKGK